MAKIAVVYYSSTGNVHALAEQVQAGAEEAGAEVRLRRAQERLHSIICVSGAVYALRRDLWRPMPAGLICDDLFVTMHVAGAGLRVGLVPEARAVDARQFTRAEHFARKITRAYEGKYNKTPQVIVTTATDGARVVGSGQ